MMNAVWQLRQSDYVCDVDGKVLVDQLVRFEGLVPNVRQLVRRLDIVGELPHQNPTNRDHYTKFYDKQTRDACVTHYGDDIGRFNYQFRPEFRERVRWFSTHTWPEFRMKASGRLRRLGQTILRKPPVTKQ